MAKSYQMSLFDPEEYPNGQFIPLHNSFTGKAKVDRYNFKTDHEPFVVDLDKGECSCSHGAAWVWYQDAKIDGKWVTNRYCVHKLKALADLIQKNGDEQNAEVMFPFMKAVATRYNQYEAISAFHKHLRRGDVEKAYFFACIVCTTRGTKGIIKYLLAIVYEETRDHRLREHLSELTEKTNISLLDMTRAIMWFCETKKKWDLHEVRVALYNHEMRGYQRLVKEFGKDVAKASEIIPEEMTPIFLKKIGSAVSSKDYNTLQYCVKGLQKSKFRKTSGLNDIRLKTANALAKAVNLRGFNLSFYKYLQRKAKTSVGISYHDLNAFADLLSGEPAHYGELSAERSDAILRVKKLPLFPFYSFPSIPIYAHDGHTYRGKYLLRTYAAQIPYGIEQTDIDLRGSGQYLGVGWRLYAMAQFGSISKPKWHQVKIPAWLRRVVLDLQY